MITARGDSEPARMTGTVRRAASYRMTVCCSYETFAVAIDDNLVRGNRERMLEGFGGERKISGLAARQGHLCGQLRRLP
jgi:hypothetical protein